MILELQNISKSFGEKQVLRGISFSAEGGRAFGLLGRNGAGKTTAIRILMGVFPADSGAVLLDGKPIDHKRVGIGYLPEERGLYPKKIILDQLVYFAELKGMTKKDAVSAVDYWLERLGMSEYRQKRLDTLSKGNQQKIQLVTALAHDPAIVILDEPFSGLDPVNAMLLKDVVREEIAKGYRENTLAELAKVPAEQLAMALDMEITALTEDALADFNDSFLPASVSESSFEDNMKQLEAVDMDTPSSINIYAKSFEDKEAIADIIADYNKDLPEEDQINYTDYVAILMSSVTTIINAISTVLIAFVAISLVVSSIMIGIITYISVLERTKEIGILRAIGASKGDISSVFNAETVVIGFISGVLGIGITALLCIPANIIIENLTDIPNVAQLPISGAVILVVISVILTLVGGLIPSGIAAKKDPVVALRSE